MREKDPLKTEDIEAQIKNFSDTQELSDLLNNNLTAPDAVLVLREVIELLNKNKS